MPAAKKKSNKKKRQNATAKFLEQSNLQFPESKDEFRKQTANGIEEMLRNFLMNSNIDDSGVPEIVRPKKVTPLLKSQIANLPRRDEIWYAHWTHINNAEEQGEEVSIYLVNKEHGSNGKDLSECDGLSFHLATSMDLGPPDPMGQCRDRTMAYPVIQFWGLLPRAV